MSTLTLSSNVNKDISGVAPFDIYLDSRGNISTSLDQEAVLQLCAQAASTVLGEMIYNTEQGIPFFQAVWIGTPNLQQYRASLRSAFLAVGNGQLVTEVISLLTSKDSNTLYYTAIIRTIYGSGSIVGNTSTNI